MSVALIIAIVLFPNVAPVGWTIGAVAFFFLYELATVLITDKKANTVSSRQSVNLFMGFKVGKILLSLFFVLIYWIAVKTEIKNFLMFFLALYLIYMVFETIYLMRREKKQKK